MTASDVAFLLAIAAALLYAASQSPLTSRYLSWSKAHIAQPVTQEKAYTPWPAPEAEPSFDVGKAVEPKFRP